MSQQWTAEQLERIRTGYTRAHYIRAMDILRRMATENTGWRSFFRRWYYADEPLRHDATELVHEAGWDEFGLEPEGTRLLEPVSRR